MLRDNKGRFVKGNVMDELCSSCHYELTYNRQMPKEITNWGHNVPRRVQP